MKIWPWVVGAGVIIIWGIRRAEAVPIDEPDELPGHPDNAVPPKVIEPITVKPVVRASDPPALPVKLLPNTLISPHFRYSEFSQHACPKKGLPVTAYPAAWVETRLKPLVIVLETIRDSFGGKSIAINSAYRSSTYNKYCTTKAATASQHLYGRAVDIVVAGVSAHVVHDRVLALYNQGKIDIGGLGRYNNFTHIDIRPGSNRLARWG